MKASMASQFCIYCHIYSSAFNTSNLALHCTEGKKLFFFVIPLLSNAPPSVAASTTNNSSDANAFPSLRGKSKLEKVMYLKCSF